MDVADNTPAAPQDYNAAIKGAPTTPEDYRAAIAAIKAANTTPEDYSAAIAVIKGAPTTPQAADEGAQPKAAGKKRAPRKAAAEGGEPAKPRKRAPRKAAAPAQAEPEGTEPTEEQGEAAPAKKRAPRKAAGKARKAKKHAEGVVAAVAEGDQGVRDALAAVSARVFVEENAPDVAGLVGAGPEVHYVRRTVRKRKRPDPAATLARYRERIVAERSEEDWASLAGAWLSDYGLYSAEACPTHHAHALIDLARERGVAVKGVCAENMKAGAYVQPTLPDGTARDAAKVVYVGGQNRFTDRERSQWAALPVDNVLV